ncbi:hypothetical protein A0J61_02807 [Choanephora cucurbitarum]|uniref:Uncharacterized protein n=1 Tax=Choanephora cucurbitarum TaxID=101091 RepID=A0A1C7NKX5_9FUNG|nr:hypothetical protein A0J61_02807 [Choanephora cucurbitarum]
MYSLSLIAFTLTACFIHSSYGEVQDPAYHPDVSPGGFGSLISDGDYTVKVQPHSKRNLLNNKPGSITNFVPPTDTEGQLNLSLVAPSKNPNNNPDQSTSQKTEEEQEE